jgi:hypothetical protein
MFVDQVDGCMLEEHGALGTPPPQMADHKRPGLNLCIAYIGWVQNMYLLVV